MQDQDQGGQDDTVVVKECVVCWTLFNQESATHCSHDGALLQPASGYAKFKREIVNHARRNGVIFSRTELVGLYHTYQQAECELMEMQAAAAARKGSVQGESERAA